MKALTAAEMREVDRLTIERHGVSSLQLMENAGGHVTELIKNLFVHWPPERRRRIAALCGKGNNGGDGFVVARRLVKDIPDVEVRVFLFGTIEELRGDALTNAQRWKELHGFFAKVTTEAEWDAARPQVAAADLVLDALFGTGLRGQVKGLAERAIRDLNEISRDATSATPAFVV